MHISINIISSICMKRMSINKNAVVKCVFISCHRKIKKKRVLKRGNFKWNRKNKRKSHKSI